MDALYLLRHSPHEDLEIRYSLRSLARHAPHIGKVWIFGDRPAFLTADTSVAERVPHDATARVTREVLRLRSCVAPLRMTEFVDSVSLFINVNGIPKTEKVDGNLPVPSTLF